MTGEEAPEITVRAGGQDDLSEMTAVADGGRSWPTSRMAAVLSVIATLVTLVASWRPSLWTDEAATISAAQRSLPELIAMARNIDAVHATYYAAMHFWLLAVPLNSFTLRLPSAIAVGLSAGLVYVLGRRLGGRRLAVIASLTFTLLPRSTWMGIEARPYAFSSLLAVAATTVLMTWLDRPTVPEVGLPPAPSSRRLLVLYAVLVGVGTALNIYLALVVLAHGATVLFLRRSVRPVLAWLVAGTVGVALAGWVIWEAIHQTGQLGGSDLKVTTLLRQAVVNQWFLGETPTSNVGTDTGGGLSWKLAAVVLATLGWLLVAAGLLGPRTRLIAMSPQTQRVASCALPWIVIPTAIVGLYSLLIDNLYNPRYFSLATGGLALLLGQGIVVVSHMLAGRHPRPRLGSSGWSVIVMAALVLISTPIYISQRGTYAKSGADWGQAAQFVASHRGPDSGVYFSPRYPVVAETVGQTSRGIKVAYPDAFTGLADVTLLRSPVQDRNLAGTSRLLRNSLPQLSELTTVFFVRRNDYAYIAEDHRTLTAAGFTPDERWVGPRDEVVRYSRTRR